MSPFPVIRMKPIAVLAWMLLASLPSLGPARQAHAASLVIAPAETTVTVGDPFTLRVLVDAVPDLKGADLVHGYTPGRLTFLSSVMGDAFADTGGETFEFTYPDVQAPPDSIWYDVARLTGTGSGPGVVVFLTFDTHSTGNATVGCLSVDLRDSNNAPLLPACAGALVHVLGPVPVRSSTWGRLKGHYR